LLKVLIKLNAYLYLIFIYILVEDIS